MTGKETVYIEDAVKSGKISGNGKYTKFCQEFFETKYGFKKALLTTSCTDALEMCAILLDIQPGDEVIVPSFTFVSTANAFVLRGAKIIFADSSNGHPNVGVNELERLVTKKTKAIVVVHYAGVACDMDPIMDLASKNKLFVVEDSAQAIDSFYKGKPLGTIGHLAAFSFHETKNIISGEGGLLAVNDAEFYRRAEIIWEKGTNRSAFWRGEVDKYNWVDIGSSFLPSEIIAAFLFAQLESLDEIQAKRKNLWDNYFSSFSDLPKVGIGLPTIPDYASNNAHMFYLICRDLADRNMLIERLKQKGIYAVFHYLCLNESPYYKKFYNGQRLDNAHFFEERLLRLPLYFELSAADQNSVISHVKDYYADK
jgi:dTDP-4-amino-4,6-dideoxygalactose transaminase